MTDGHPGLPTSATGDDSEIHRLLLDPAPAARAFGSA